MSRSVGLVLVCLVWVALGCDDTTTAAPVAPRPDGGRDAQAPDATIIRCVPSVEICNGVDDDCDGLVDDADDDLSLALFSDLSHCGACFAPCEAPRATLACQVGQCIITGCAPGFGDYNGRLEDGCETDCIVTGGGIELCDDVDNDCDGLTDEAFDLQSDSQHCGACGVVCPVEDGGRSRCIEGECSPLECEPGRVDLDGESANGCEYDCAANVDGDGSPEDCNGLDDDCDGRVDEAADLPAPPPDLCPSAGVCAAECALDADCDGEARCRGGVCSPAQIEPIGCEIDADCQAVHRGLACLDWWPEPGSDEAPERRCAPRHQAGNCDGAENFRCVYPPERQFVGEAGACDGLDNDCDGRTDEDFAPTLLADDRRERRACAVGFGLCRREGLMRCSASGQATICDATPAEPDGIDDTCDGVDEDCDGRVDEGFQDAFVALDGVLIYAYEASRPGADAAQPGPPSEGSRACSRAGALPWADVSWAQAVAACEAAGARLCAADEWSAACGGALGQPFPYGARYASGVCNGAESPWEGLLSGGEAVDCVRDGVFDLSGNVKEWVVGGTANLRPVRGGSYESDLPAGLSCDQEGDLKVPQFHHPAIGFRCCVDRP